MNVEFFSSDPRSKARRTLDQLMHFGADQLVLACAFCTAAGARLLESHSSLLARDNSFVVISAQPPTDYKALARVHSLIGSNLLIHWGNLAPREKKNGAALMHSKVFYARRENECWLWTGSHNLTANATQGANCEASILLHGHASEEPFVRALEHLNACRREATPYDPEIDPPNLGEEANIVSIHVEAESIPHPDDLPRLIHLCLETPEFDHQLSPPADVRLHVYLRGSLQYGRLSSRPVATFIGSLSGLNLTAINPNAFNTGTVAAWNEANLSIVDLNGILVLMPPSEPSPLATTQAVLSISSVADAEELLLRTYPKTI